LKKSRSRSLISPRLGEDGGIFFFSRVFVPPARSKRCVLIPSYQRRRRLLLSPSLFRPDFSFQTFFTSDGVSASLVHVHVSAIRIGHPSTLWPTIRRVQQRPILRHGRDMAESMERLRVDLARARIRPSILHHPSFPETSDYSTYSPLFGRRLDIPARCLPVLSDLQQR